MCLILIKYLITHKLLVMKRIYISLLLSLLFLSCSQELDLLGNDDNLTKEKTPISLSFAISNHAIKTIQSRSASSESIHSLRILIFDEHNNFLYSRKAILGSNITAPNGDDLYLPDGKQDSIDQVLQVNVDLLSSSKKRTLHLIANYNWNGFPQDYFIEGKSEGEVIGAMKSKEETYWSRIELPNINPNILKGKTIKLLRNYAQISVNSEATDNFNFIGFTVHNTLQEGTIAPFRHSETSFNYEFPYAPEYPTIPTNSLVNTPRDFKQTPIHVFEQISEGKNPAFVIVKGIYNNSPSESYYKVDLKNTNKETGVTTLHNIIRNFKYIITIGSVTSEGYPTAEEAARQPASNNLFASIELADYPSVSDGNSILTIDKLGGFFTSPDVFETKVFFTHGIKNIKLYPSWKESNDFIESVELIPNEQFPEYGVLRVKIKNIPKEGLEELTLDVVAYPNINSMNNLITRKLVFRLRTPYQLQAELISKGNQFNDEIQIHIKMPPNMHKSVLPFDIFISTTELTPNLSSNEVNNHILLKIIDGKYYYSYQVKEIDLKNNITLNFVRNDSNKSEEVRLSSKYFDEEMVILPQ